MCTSRGVLFLSLTLLASWFSGVSSREKLLSPTQPAQNSDVTLSSALESVSGGNLSTMATTVTASTTTASGGRNRGQNSGSSQNAYRGQVLQQSGRLAHPKPEDVQVGCKELRSKRYFSDGFCTSAKPITEVVCTGHCLPIRNLPWYAEFLKVWARTKILEWRCVDDVVRHKRVRLLCENGETQTYKVKVVKSCKCKRYMRQQNESPARHRSNGRHHRKKDNPNKTRNNESSRP